MAAAATLRRRQRVPRRTIPTGTVTFLFSDIEGSSTFWEQAGSAMAAALARHDEIVRAAIDRHGGWIFSVGGDGFGVAFARAADALASAIDAQRALQHEAWPGPVELRVRMGMHTGEAEERDGTYFGHSVNVAARLMAAADRRPDHRVGGDGSGRRRRTRRPSWSTWADSACAGWSTPSGRRASRPTGWRQSISPSAVVTPSSAGCHARRRHGVGR